MVLTVIVCSHACSRTFMSDCFDRSLRMLPFTVVCARALRSFIPSVIVTTLIVYTHVCSRTFVFDHLIDCCDCYRLQSCVLSHFRVRSFDRSLRLLPFTVVCLSHFRVRSFDRSLRLSSFTVMRALALSCSII